jgi:RNase H-fold protein (predicted Holliday junction resolvase)
MVILLPNEIAVTTLDGRAYYIITSILKEMGLKFDNVMPGQNFNPSVKLVITTEKERNLINHEKVLSLEELSKDPYLAKEKIIDNLYSNSDESIIIGIDPGKRTGMVVYYRQRELMGDVLSSIDETITKVVKLVSNTHAKKRIVRIGNGEPDMAEKIANELSKSLKNVIIELVDERGTSSLSKIKPNKKVARDQRSAMLIALRQGKRYFGD